MNNNTKREIKFRAWDKKDKKMILPQDGYMVGMEGEQIFRQWDGDFFDETILLQFTGLLDRHGKEIYEGDIIKDFFQNKIGKITWESVSWVVRFGDEKLNYYYLENYLNKDFKSLEVIGNIYENSYLLKLK